MGHLFHVVVLKLSLAFREPFLLLHFSRCQFYCDVVPNVANRDVNEAYPTTYLYTYILFCLPKGFMFV